MEQTRKKYVSMQQRICFQTFRLVLKRAVLDKKIETRFSTLQKLLVSLQQNEWCEYTLTKNGMRKNTKLSICEGFPLSFEGVSGGFPRVSEGFLHEVNIEAKQTREQAQ